MSFRFSGLTTDNMKGATTTLRDVQAKLMKMFTDKTILIGHSLESDLLALKVCEGIGSPDIVLNIKGVILIYL